MQTVELELYSHFDLMNNVNLLRLDNCFADLIDLTDWSCVWKDIAKSIEQDCVLTFLRT